LSAKHTLRSRNRCRTDAAWQVFPSEHYSLADWSRDGRFVLLSALVPNQD